MYTMGHIKKSFVFNVFHIMSIFLYYIDIKMFIIKAYIRIFYQIFFQTSLEHIILALPNFSPL